MVGRFIIEDEYTINVKLQRDANYIPSSPPPPLTFSYVTPLNNTNVGNLNYISYTDQKVNNGSNTTLTVQCKQPSPLIRNSLYSTQNTSLGSTQHTPMLTLVPPPKSHITSVNALHLVKGESEKANLFVHKGYKNGRGNSVKEVICAGEVSYMSDKKKLSPLNQDAVHRKSSYDKITSNDEKNDFSFASNNIAVLPKEKKKSNVKMVVTLSDDRKSPTIKRLPDYTSEECPSLDLLPFASHSTPMRMMTSFGDVVPFKPMERYSPSNSFSKELDQYEPSITVQNYTISPPPSSSPFTVPDLRVTTATNSVLPLVQVFAEDNTLVSKNTFLSPLTSSRSSQHTLKQRESSLLNSTNYDQTLAIKCEEVKPRGPGSLFVRPIKQHCASGSGELYVAPVDASILHSTKRDTPLKGNSRRVKQSKTNRGKIQLQETTPPNSSLPNCRHSTGESKMSLNPKSNVDQFPFSKNIKKAHLVNRCPHNDCVCCEVCLKNGLINLPNNDKNHQNYKKSLSNAAMNAKNLNKKYSNINNFQKRQFCLPNIPNYETDFSLNLHSQNSNRSKPKAVTFSVPAEGSYGVKCESSKLPFHKNPTPKHSHVPSFLPSSQYSVSLYPQLDNSLSLPSTTSFPLNVGPMSSPPPLELHMGPHSSIFPLNSRRPQSAHHFKTKFCAANIEKTHQVKDEKVPFGMDAARALLTEVLRDVSASPLRTNSGGISAVSNHSSIPQKGNSTSDSKITRPRTSLSIPASVTSPQLGSRSGRTVNRTIQKSSESYQERMSPAIRSNRLNHRNHLVEGERVSEVYSNVSSTPGLTSSGRTSNEERYLTNQVSSRGVEPTHLTSVDLQNKSENMLVTNEPPIATHLNMHSFEKSLINSNKGNQIQNSRAVKYFADESNDTCEGHENLAYETSSIYGHENHGFEPSFGYLPFGDACPFDPGYGSEKSEEEEINSVLQDDYYSSSSSSSSSDDESNPSSYRGPPDGISLNTGYLMRVFPFIRESTMFDVTLVRNARGLGLAVTGGIECEGSVLPGLIRIKKLYPQTPAWLCGQLQVNDFLLEANRQQLTGLTSNEALEVLRATGGEVTLLVCRAPEEVLNSNEDFSHTDSKERTSLMLNSLTAPQSISGCHYLSPSPSFSNCGEFEIQLKKVSGSLGFTLRKNDNSILGHTIRSLVREPALSDGRIRPGDKLLSVNGTDMCGLSHEEVVRFLRTCPESVVIRLYRDAMQTPVSPASPTEAEFFSKPKQLRKEARDMLSDLAFRKQSSPSILGILAIDTPTTPRRRRLHKPASPETKDGVDDRWESLVREAEIESPPEIPSVEDIIQRNELNFPREASPFDNSQADSLTISSSSRSGTIISRNSSNSYKELSRDFSNVSPSNSSCSESRPRRPNFLDLTSCHSSSKKSHFTPPHEEDVLFPSPPASRQFDSLDSAPQLTSTHSDTPAFSHLQSGYRSVNIGSLYPSSELRLTNTSSDNNLSTHGNNESPLKKNTLLKWKGVVFTPEEEEEESKVDFFYPTPSTDDAECTPESHTPKVVTIEMTRGWNSRLGFSLQRVDDQTVIVAIYSDSVAAKDGRLQIGDVILEVNGNDVTSWDTESVIDLLRKIRGKIALKILQAPV